MSDPRHQWIGATWTPLDPVAAFDAVVRRSWPACGMVVVRGGAIWLDRGRIVGELRNRFGWPPWEVWVAEPREGQAR